VAVQVLLAPPLLDSGCAAAKLWSQSVSLCKLAGLSSISSQRIEFAMNKRESYPPRSSSIGRVQPAEPIAAHPLDTTATPRYVPYTPRQRVGPPPTASTPPLLQNQSQASTGKVVYLANLKGAAQALGVGKDSTGWAILERLVGSGGEDVEWGNIWRSLGSGRVSFILLI